MNRFHRAAEADEGIVSKQPVNAGRQGRADEIGDGRFGTEGHGFELTRFQSATAKRTYDLRHLLGLTGSGLLKERHDPVEGAVWRVGDLLHLDLAEPGRHPPAIEYRHLV